MFGGNFSNWQQTRTVANAISAKSVVDHFDGFIVTRNVSEASDYLDSLTFRVMAKPARLNYNRPEETQKTRFLPSKMG